MDKIIRFYETNPGEALTIACASCSGARGLRAFKTWLQTEEAAYPRGGQTRMGAAMFPDGVVRRVWGGIADTWFSIPAHGQFKGRSVTGFLTFEEWGGDGYWDFNFNR